MKSDIDNKEIPDLFNEAERFMKDERFIDALLCYDRIIRFDGGYSANYEAYFGLYTAWWNHNKSLNKWCYKIEDYFNTAVNYAPPEKKEEYYKIWNENSAVFNKGGEPQ